MLVSLAPEIDFTGVATPRECAKPIIIDAKAVLRAADDWLAAQEALIAAQQSFKETEVEEERVDVAGVKLAVMVKRWRAQIVAPTEGDMQLRQSHAGWR